MATYRVITGDKEYEVKVEDDGLGGATVTVEGESFHVEATGGAPTPRTGSAVPLPAPPAAPTSAAASAATASTRPTASPASSGSITAPIPGVVTALLVKIGDQVSAGQIVLKLEAMKMENDIASPVAGTVKDIPVAEGAQVSDGQLLMMIS